MWKAFHHPDISFPVVRRRISLELIEMLEMFGELTRHGALSFIYSNRIRPNNRSLDQAIGRLTKQGLVVTRRGLDTPLLKLTEGVVLEDYFYPEKWWNKKWNGIWYQLVYDVPEADRSYRNILRDFLKKQRMGCFQKSVWITPSNIRPQYADLDEAAALGAFACLFEARTVLGMSADQVVQEAWDMDRLYDIQKLFCDIYLENQTLMEGCAELSQEELMRLAAEELAAYRSAFVLDPLLPEALLPHNYKGKDALAIHRNMIETIRLKLRDANSN